MTSLRNAWIISANTALLYCVLQVAAWAGLAIHDTVIPALTAAPGLTEAERANYSHMSERDRDEMLRVTRNLRFRFEPVVGFLLQETHSRFVNIGPTGIRSNGTPREPQPLDGNIWFLGGSTAVGTGVADHETIPAQLERLIGREVINLGVSNYATADENLLLAQYVRLGLRPSMAIFFDGINEACFSDLYVEEMRALVTRVQYEFAWDIGGPARWALQRIIRRSRRLLHPPQPVSIELACVHNGRTTPLAEIHATRLAERHELCAARAITCHTLVQPFAGLHGRREGFPEEFLNGDALDLARLYAHLEPAWKADGSIFLTDVFDGYNRHAFIDEVHYSADANRILAEAIARRLALKPGN